jgi:hypothetical protein
MANVNTVPGASLSVARALATPSAPDISPPTSISCGVSTGCIWSIPSPVRGCCEGLLALQGCKIGRRHVKTLMKRMRIEALYRRPRTTKPEPGHKIYRYLPRGMEITRPNQVWAMDITYSAPRPERSGKRMSGMH